MLVAEVLTEMASVVVVFPATLPGVNVPEAQPCSKTIADTNMAVATGGRRRMFQTRLPGMFTRGISDPASIDSAPIPAFIREKFIDQ